jgi:hypothetical protein
VSGLEIDQGLLRRLRAAGAKISWRAAVAPAHRRGGPDARLARLAEEDARVETTQGSAGAVVEVDSGPVGAVVLLLEADRRGPPSHLGSRAAGRSPSFPAGSIVAAWGTARPEADATPSVRDLVELARYALP